MPKLASKFNEQQIAELENVLNHTKLVADLRKIQAILMLDRNQNLDIIEALTSIKRSRVFGLRKQYLDKGLDAIRTQERKGKLLLSRKQLNQLKKILKDPSSPITLYQTPFWSTRLLADYIKEEFDVDYKSKTSIYLIFKRVKFTYHKPGRVYEKHDSDKVTQWIKTTKPMIEKAWNDEDTVILTADEMILSTQTTWQKVWIPEGEYPQVKVSNTRKNKSIYGFLNIKTGRETSFATEKQNMYVTKRILQNIRKIYPKKDNNGNKLKGKKILLFWDGPGWHRGSVVTDYIKKDGDIQVIFFPPYSPEENPQEHVWKEGRGKVTHNHFIKDLDQTAKEFVNYLNTTRFDYSLLGFNPTYRC